MREQLINPDAVGWKWLRTIAAAVVVPLIVWGVSVEIRIQVIEGNRHTAADERDSQAAIYRELSKKADKINVPPPEVRVALDRVDDALDRLTALLENHIQWHLDHDR